MQQKKNNSLKEFILLGMRSLSSKENLDKIILSLRENLSLIPKFYAQPDVFKRLFNKGVESFDSLAISFYHNKPLQAGVFSFSFAFALATLAINYTNYSSLSNQVNTEGDVSKVYLEKFLKPSQNLAAHYKFTEEERQQILFYLSGLNRDKNQHIHNLFSSKLQAFKLLLESTEGKKNKFYKDNKGIAIAYGWNPTQNTKEFNLKIAQALRLNNKETKNIVRISENDSIQSVPSFLEDFSLNDRQLSTILRVTLNSYEKEFLNVLKVKSEEKQQNFEKIKNKYLSLPFNQQAVFVHMVYKVGATNLLKYDEFFDNIFSYLNNPSIENLNIAANSFTYSYYDRSGKMKRDVRVEKVHSTFFSDCLASNLMTNPNSLENCKKIALK